VLHIADWTGSGELFMQLDNGTGYWSYWGDGSIVTKFESVGGVITSYHAVPDTGSTFILLGMAILTLPLWKRH
jgi:VPDSG-CTERM motif